MTEYILKLPDVGEGVAEAEIVEWLVEPGAFVREDDILASVMTDKATVEIPSPVDGTIIEQGGRVGEIIAVGSPLVRLETGGAGTASQDLDAGNSSTGTQQAVQNVKAEPSQANGSGDSEQIKRVLTASERPLASPAVRRKAAEAGIDLRNLHGSGPSGRITIEDIAIVQNGAKPQRADASKQPANDDVLEIPVVGLRRKIAEKMALSKARIPHISIIEEVDITELDAARKTLNESRREGRAKLTLLPFLMRALDIAIAQQPGFNAHYDDEAGVIRQYSARHIGIATQTPNGLIVPVIRNVEALSLWDCADEIALQSAAAREGSAKRDALSGSTITITSLGPLGAIATTPIINHPEVAIIGVNKIRTAPVWDGTQFIPRQMMNLSSSFDHRVIDGYDAAVFVQRVKQLLEAPVTLFVEP